MKQTLVQLFKNVTVKDESKFNTLFFTVSSQITELKKQNTFLAIVSVTARMRCSAQF